MYAAAASAHRRLRQADERVAVLEPLTSVSAAAAVAGCIEGLMRWMNTTMIDAEVLSSWQSCHGDWYLLHRPYPSAQAGGGAM